MNASRSQVRGNLLTIGSFCLLTLIVGCGKGPGASLAPVSGLVTLDGDPVPSALVTFYPEQGRPSVAQTDAEGRFELQFTESFAGAVVGRHSVHISYGGPAEPGAPGAPNQRASRNRNLPATSVDWPESIMVQDSGTNHFEFSLPVASR